LVALPGNYQVVSGVITTTDLVATNGQNTVHLVSTHYVNAASELASFVTHKAAVTSAASAAASTSSMAVILAALSVASLALTVAAISAGTVIIYKRHRQAQAILAAHDQGTAHDIKVRLATAFLLPCVACWLLNNSSCLLGWGDIRWTTSSRASLT
jgi:hypothetical protein